MGSGMRVNDNLKVCGSSSWTPVNAIFVVDRAQEYLTLDGADCTHYYGE